MSILQDARKERITIFLNAYQIRSVLNEKNSPICERLRESYGNGVGEGAGERFTPVVRISQALSRSKKTEHYYMDGRLTKLRIGNEDIEPAYIYDIFRLRENDKAMG